MIDENYEDEKEEKTNSFQMKGNNDSENEEQMNPSDIDEPAINLEPISQNIKEEMVELKDFKSLDKTDKNKLKFSYLTKFFQKFSELKGRRKSE